jgi:formylglycine-generating enzyme required for sulfatase activity
MAEIFISYKSERRKAAGHLAKILERYGYTVWFDYSLVKGRDFAAQIDAQIREAKALIVLWCSLSVRSEWVADEAALAAKLDILVPAKIEPCELRVDFDRKDYIDLTGWGGAPRDHKLDPLLDGIAHRVGRPPQLDFRAMRDYEEDWRRFGAPSLKAFALEEPVKAEEPRPVPPQRLPHGPSPAERDWERFGIAASEDVEEIEAYIKQYEGSEPLWAVKAKKRLAVVEALPRERAEAARAEAADRARREEAARLAAQQAAERQRQEQEARYRAEGRIRVPAAFPEPAGLEWFLPGAGTAEGFKDLEVGPEMVVLPAGEFWMGSKEDKDTDELPRHKVTIAQPFAVGRYTITFDEWDAAVAAGGISKKPSDQGFGRGRRPVISVSWADAEAYCGWLSEATGKPYRLLSEAEWEYACRSGTETHYSFGDNITRRQVHAGEVDSTAEVGSFPPNKFGLYDMHGNVWEWCADWWNRTYTGAPCDGSPWTTGDCGKRVLRGWGSSQRFKGGPETVGFYCGLPIYFIGFRVARTIPLLSLQL